MLADDTSRWVKQNLSRPLTALYPQLTAAKRPVPALAALADEARRVQAPGEETVRFRCWVQAVP